MISNIGRKVIFIHPSEELQQYFLEHVFKNGIELYILNDAQKVYKVAELFPNAILFFNLDKVLDHQEWIKMIRIIHSDAKNKDITIGVFSKEDNPILQHVFLMDIGIRGGFIVLKKNIWHAVQIVNKVLEANEAKGQRQSVRLNFQDSHVDDNLEVKIFTIEGVLLKGIIKSFSALGLLVEIDNSRHPSIPKDGIDKIIYYVCGEAHHISGLKLKTIAENRYFIWFKDFSDSDRDTIQEYVFNSLQKSFNKLLKLV